MREGESQDDVSAEEEAIAPSGRDRLTHCGKRTALLLLLLTMNSTLRWRVAGHVWQAGGGGVVVMTLGRISRVAELGVRRNEAYARGTGGKSAVALVQQQHQQGPVDLKDTLTLLPKSSSSSSGDDAAAIIRGSLNSIRVSAPSFPLRVNRGLAFYNDASSSATAAAAFSVTNP
ncbi:unnamed protein product [Lampetra fluviatilis]